MVESRDRFTQAGREIAASSKTSPTPPGLIKEPIEATTRATTTELVEAINQVFALFRLNYHNQYYAAYPDGEQLSQIKKLWLDSLRDYPVEQILRGARHAIENSEYLPTLHRMHDCCREGMAESGLPSARDAYVEACRAASPKSAQPWSHPAVYLAGRDSDWFFLANNIERYALPIYRKHYQHYCELALQGKNLEIPTPEALERQPGKPLTREQQLQQLRKLRQQTGIDQS